MSAPPLMPKALGGSSKHYNIHAAEWYNDTHLSKIVGNVVARKRPSKRTVTAPQDITSLLAALDNPDSEVRRIAIEALGHNDSPDATAALIVMLNDRDSNIRSWAAGMLGGVGSTPGRPEAVEPLITALHDTDAYVRGDAAISLGLLRDHRAASALMQCLTDSSPAVRGHAANALGSIGAGEASVLLATTLHDPERIVRVWSAVALRNLHWSGATDATPLAVPALIAALQDSDATVREKAANALGTIRDVRAVDPLLAALKDDEVMVRYAAVEALEEIGDPRALPALQWVVTHDQGTTFLGNINERAVQAIAWLQTRASDT